MQATPLGILVSLGEKSKFKPLRWLVNFYVWIMRGTPLLLQLIFVFYGLPIIGIVFQRYDAALVAFILNYAAYFAEIFRGGFQSVSVGQYEAAKVVRQIDHYSKSMAQYCSVAVGNSDWAVLLP